MRMILTIACCALHVTSTLANEVTRGYALLNANCAVCHAIGVEGESPHEEAPPFRVIMKAYAATSLSEALGEGLVTGHPDMPEFKFEAADVGAIVSYLETLEGLK